MGWKWEGGGAAQTVINSKLNELTLSLQLTAAFIFCFGGQMVALLLQH